MPAIGIEYKIDDAEGRASKRDEDVDKTSVEVTDEGNLYREVEMGIKGIQYLRNKAEDDPDAVVRKISM